MSTQKLTFSQALEQQKSSWMAGNPVPIEELLGFIGDSDGEAEDLLMDLIYNEVLVRESIGEQPSVSDYQSRFPKVQHQISRQFQVHNAIEKSSVAGSPDENKPSPAITKPEIPGFEVVELIGHGGSGIAWRARDLTLGREVAIKVVGNIVSVDRSSQAHFRHEAESVAALNHSAIVPIYQVGDFKDAPYLVMAFIDGCSLAERLQSGPLPPEQAVSLMSMIANAVHYAHEQGIIHRDLKPGNILLDKSDQPFVCDFGLARKLDSEQTLQTTGQVIGTPAYMPPEQARGYKADELSDLYSLGVVLYEMLSGHSPFQSTSSWHSIHRVINHDAVPLRQLDSTIPKDLETICHKCMEKSGTARYQTVAEFESELERFLAGQPIVARRVGVAAQAIRWCRREPKLAGLMGIAALLAIGLTAAITIAALKIRDANSVSDAARETAIVAKVDALVSAAPDAVSLVIGSLDFGDPKTEKLLLEKANDHSLDTRSRLNAALGLASDASFQHQLVADCVSDLPLESGSCRNITRYFRDSGPKLIEACQQKTIAGNVDSRFRYAVLALFLGDQQAAEELARPGPDPNPRTTLIHNLKDWHGGYDLLAELLAQPLDPDLMSAICIGVGRIDPKKPNAADRAAVTEALVDLYRQTSEGRVRNASHSAMLSWGIPIPDAIESVGSDSKSWHTTSSGLTLVRIPAGEFTMGSDDPRLYMLRHKVKLERGFWMADREIDVELFREFMEATDEASSWMPDQVISPGDDHPAQNLSWLQAIGFCNWLSQQEGLPLAYSRIEDDEAPEGSKSGWRCDFRSAGYRLPSDAEWGYAARCNATTRFSFGDDPSVALLHVRASNHVKINSFPCGSLIPNAFGLFDMEGNVWEWVWDQYNPNNDKPLASLHDPGVEEFVDFSKDRVIRGGGVDNRGGDASAETRGNYRPGSTGWNVGFRVVRTTITK